MPLATGKPEPDLRLWRGHLSGWGQWAIIEAVLLAKYALSALILLAAVDVIRRQLRSKSAEATQKEALMTREDEGGALP